MWFCFVGRASLGNAVFPSYLFSSSYLTLRYSLLPPTLSSFFSATFRSGLDYSSYILYDSTAVEKQKTKGEEDTGYSTVALWYGSTVPGIIVRTVTTHVLLHTVLGCVRKRKAAK